MYSQLHRKFSHESGVERILKIGPHLPKLLSNIKGYTLFGTRCSCAFTVNRLQCCLTSTIQYQQCSSDLLHSGIIYFTVLCCCCFSLLHISMAFATVNLQCTKDAVTAPFMCMLAACNRISASKYFYYVVQVNYSCCQSRNWKLLHLYCCPVAKILRLVVHCYLTTRMHSRFCNILHTQVWKNQICYQILQYLQEIYINTCMYVLFSFVLERKSLFKCNRTTIAITTVILINKMGWPNSWQQIKSYNSCWTQYTQWLIH